MTRRVVPAFFLLVFCASLAWPKWKEEEQQYLDTNFRAIQDQVQALAAQLQTANAHLVELRQNQAQLQAVIIRQQRALQDLEQLVSSMRINGEENFSGLKSGLTQLRTETQKSFASLMGKASEAAAGGAEAVAQSRTAAVAQPQVIQGYVSDVKENNVLVDIGSSQGLHSGSRLVVYKASEPNARAGVLEVTQVVDAGNSRARIVTMNPGLRPEFGDIVRLE